MQRLEKGELPLEESLVLYEEGIRLSRLCHAKLEEAEGKIELLLKDARGDARPRRGRQARRRRRFRRRVTTLPRESAPTRARRLDARRADAALDGALPAGGRLAGHHPPRRALQPVRGRQAHPARCWCWPRARRWAAADGRR